MAGVLESARVKACPVASLEMKAERKYMNGEFRFKYLVYARNGLPISHFHIDAQSHINTSARRN